MFSVVIPAYNCQKTIEQVLDSVRQQTRFDLITEIIIINDGSTDRTEQVIDAYKRQYPNLPIRYIFQENRGVSRARNRGILEAKSEWIALLDSDDQWLSHKISRQYDTIQEGNQIFFLGATAPIGLFGKKQGLVKLTAHELCMRSMPSTPSVVFHRQTGLDLGLFREDIHYCEDIQFFQKFLQLDSYYILFEELVQINIGKSFHGQVGLSSHLKEMSQGRDRNVRELQQMGLISKQFMWLMLGFNQLKFIRRKLIVAMSKRRKG